MIVHYLIYWLRTALLSIYLKTITSNLQNLFKYKCHSSSELSQQLSMTLPRDYVKERVRFLYIFTEI